MAEASCPECPTTSDMARHGNLPTNSTGNASAFKERLTIGTVDLICTEPVNVLARFNSEPMLAAPCAMAGRLKVVLPGGRPVVASNALMVTTADCLDGLAQ